jgi:predicted hotdog family 3-hydroxylacyl-ACP dehydratase
LLSEITNRDDTELSARAVVGTGLLLSPKTGTVSIALSVEYIGQAIAAHLASFGPPGPIRAGFIIRMRRVRFERSELVPGDHLLVSVVLSDRTGDSASYSGTLTSETDGATLAQGEFLVHVPEAVGAPFDGNRS